jgi:NAD(P)H-flavin reductase
VGAVDPWIPEPSRIERVRRETRDTFTLALDKRPFCFEPGQFNMLYLFGVGEVAISISGDPDADALVHTIRAVGTVTRAIARLTKGDALGVRGPFGTGWPVSLAEGGDLLVIAGGVGLAPVRPIVYRALRDRARFGRVILLVGARTPDDLLFAKELERWRARGACDVRITVDHAGPSWTGPVGVVPALIDGLAIDPARTIAMMCGPEVMMRFSARALEARGLSRDRIFLSMERNMKCATAFCGHCQYGPAFVCRDGPVFRFDRIEWLLERREI